MAEKHGWGPERVGELTMYQASMYAGAFTVEHGRIRVDPKTASYLVR